MAEPARWARTRDQIDLLHAARSRGGLCAACGRELGDGEVVYVERFAVGVKRPTWAGGAGHQAFAFAPVGVECASPELLARTEGHDPDPCAWCGRLVFYRVAPPTRGRATCSRRCVSRLGHARRRETAAGD